MTSRSFYIFSSIVLILALLLLIFLPSDTQPGTTLSQYRDAFDNPVFCKSPWSDVPVFYLNQAEAYLLPRDVVEKLGSPTQIKRLFPGEISLIADAERVALENYSILFVNAPLPPVSEITAAYERALRNNGWQLFSCEQQIDRARGKITICQASRHTPLPDQSLPETELNDHFSLLIAIVDNGLLLSHYRLIPVSVATRCPAAQ